MANTYNDIFALPVKKGCLSKNLLQYDVNIARVTIPFSC